MYHYKNGLGYLTAKDWDRAELEFRFILDHDPSFSQAHLGLASLYFRKGQMNLADYHVSEILSLKPEWAQARLLKGKILYQKEKYSEVLQYLPDIIPEFNGQNSNQSKSEWNLYKGLALQALGEMDKSSVYIANSLKYVPENPEAISALQFQNIYNTFKNQSHNEFKRIMLTKVITRSDWAWLLANELDGSEVYNVRNLQLPPDVPLTHLAKQEIMNTLNSQILFTFPDGSFMPERTLRRAEIILIAINLKIIDNVGPEISDKRIKINDLPDWHPLYQDAVKSVAVGLLDLDQTYNIRMNDVITGRQAIEILYKLIKKNQREI